MGRLSYKGIAEVDAMNPCAGFAQICQLNNVPSDHQGTVLTCTYLAHTNIHQISWLIVYMEPVHAIEIIKDIYTASKGNKLTIEEIQTSDDTKFDYDSPEVKEDKDMYQKMKLLFNANYPRSESLDRQLLNLLVIMLHYLKKVSNKDMMQIIQDGLIVFDNKVV